MLVVFSPIFVADTKIIFCQDFVAPLTNFFKKNEKTGKNEVCPANP